MLFFFHKSLTRKRILNTTKCCWCFRLRGRSWQVLIHPDVNNQHRLCTGPTPPPQKKKKIRKQQQRGCEFAEVPSGADRSRGSAAAGERLQFHGRACGERPRLPPKPMTSASETRRKKRESDQMWGEERKEKPRELRTDG